MLENLHAGEEILQLVRNEIFKGDVAQAGHAFTAVYAHKARQHLWNLEARKLLSSGLRVAHADSQVQRQPRDVGEGVCGVHSKWHEHREDLVGEVAVQNFVVCFIERTPGDYLDACLRKSWLHTVVIHLGVTQLQFMGTCRNICEHITGCSTNVGGHRQTGHDAALETCDPHHKELVQVAGKDGQEVGSFEQRELLIFS